MRVCHILFVVAVALFANSEALSDGRKLRSDIVVDINTNDVDEERAAPIKFIGSSTNKADMDKMLTTWLNKKQTVASVAKKLGFNNVPQNAAALNPNWGALLKYTRMISSSKKGNNYAYFGTGYQTEAKTKENLMKWILADDSIQDVAKTLKVYGLARNELVTNRNYNAFKTFIKWRKEWKGMKEQL